MSNEAKPEEWVNEPWQESGSAIVDADAKWVETIGSQKIRRRIVACVNACARITTASLEEAGKDALDWAGRIEVLAAEKEALQRVVDGINAILAKHKETP
jgi:hypothetical protein